MKHFLDEEYDSLKEYETHIGCNYEPDKEEHSMLWREEYEHEYDDYDKGMLFRD